MVMFHGYVNDEGDDPMISHVGMAMVMTLWFHIPHLWLMFFFLHGIYQGIL